MFEFTLNRIEPGMPPGAYQQYELNAPMRTHYRQATCTEVDCPARQHGWRMGFDVSIVEKANAVKWIRLHSGRSFTTEQVGNSVVLTFPAGQDCFETHQVPLEREPFYVIRGGDWRAQTSAPQRYREADWVDHFANHQDKLATRIEQG